MQKTVPKVDPAIIPPQILSQLPPYPISPTAHPPPSPKAIAKSTLPFTINHRGKRKIACRQPNIISLGLALRILSHGKRSGKRREIVCRFFRFRDQEFLKSLIFAKSETKIPKLASLRQSGFSFQGKTQEFKDF
jgi:hypothetical protein